MLFLIFQKGIRKTLPGIFRFLSMLFVIFEKRDKKKNSARYFKIRKDAFLTFEKGDKQKIYARFLRISKYRFLNI